ncbi:MAG: right-handed parallel beta-helix repeat-containing protein, partial [Candidatus Sifarchaeia archaeon]
MSQSQASSDPVSIYRDSDFVTQGWPGAGTELDPYRISWLSFDGGQRPFIDIQNVSASFIIENCETHTGSTWASDPEQFSIRNASHFVIANCTFEGYGQHIDARYSQSLSVSDCSFIDGQAGFFFHIDSVSFTSNYVQRCFGLLTTQGCSQLTISGNTFL